jgi:DNA-binding MarR family transcriptional regulator
MAAITGAGIPGCGQELQWWIMKSFNMNNDDLKWFRIGEAGRPDFETDEAGRLYSPQARAIVASHGPAESIPAREAWAALGHAARLMHLAMERFAEKEGLSEMRLGILFMLRHAGDNLPLGTLAAKLHVSPRNVTGLVDNLERDGLVVRVPDPADRRSVLARLTERGRERVDGLWQVAAERQSALLAGFDAEELAQLRHLCLRLVQNLSCPLQTDKE